MSGVWGNKLKISIFGESHGVGIGVVINGLPTGFEVDWDEVLVEMARRAPGQNDLTTPRKESDLPEVLSGLFEGKTTGAPLTAIIRNQDTRSKDYSQLKNIMRPGQADYPGPCVMAVTMIIAAAVTFREGSPLLWFLLERSANNY